MALVQVKDPSSKLSYSKSTPVFNIPADKRWDSNAICYLPLEDTLGADDKRPIVKLFFIQNSVVVTFASPRLGIR